MKQEQIVKPYLIGITGGSGSGKTTFIKELRNAFSEEEVCILSQDDYYFPRDQQQSDAAAIEPIIDAVLEKFADKVVEYKKGKKGLLSLFVGEVMKQSKGKADPKLTHTLLLEKLQ